MFQQLFRFFLGQVETKIDEAPPEVFNVKLSVSIVVHSLKDLGKLFDASWTSAHNFWFKLSDQVIYVKSM